VARAAVEEVRFLLRRRSLSKLVTDTGVSDARRVRFRAVLAARQFGTDSLGLAVGGTYTTFVDVGRDTLVLVLSARPRSPPGGLRWLAQYPITAISASVPLNRKPRGWSGPATTPTCAPQAHFRRSGGSAIPCSPPP